MTVSYSIDESDKRMPQRKVGTYHTNCAECGRELEGLLWTDNPTSNPDDIGCDFIRGEKKCRCGALWLIADDGFDDDFKLYPLNDIAKGNLVKPDKPREKE